MSYRRLALFSIPVFAAALALCGCSSSLMNPSSDRGSNSGMGAAPVVVAIGDQVGGVAPNRKQEVQFNEPMDPSTINAQSFQVSDSSGKLAQGVLSYDPDFNTASFFPDPALQAGTTYTAAINTSVTSADGIHLASPYSYTFSTRSDPDTSPLIVNAVNPSANATCVGATTTITITFDEAPDASTVAPGNFMVSGPNGAIAVKLSTNVATTQVVLTPSSPLPTGTITVTVDNVADLAGVKMAAPYTWSFSTACGGGGGGGSNIFAYAGLNGKIAGFAIAADGSATAVPGSPFALGGIGLAASQSGNFVFGAGQTAPASGMAFYTYSVGADGSLSTASSTTEMSTDPNPINPGVPPRSLGWIVTDRTETTLYGEAVTGSSSSGDQWVGDYSIGASGSLSLIGNIGLEYEHSPLSFTPNNRYAYLVAIPPMSNPSVISWVTRNPDGTLTGNGALSLAQPAGAPAASMPAYAVVNPNSNYLAVLYQQNAMAGFGTSSGIAVYPINSDGSVGTPTAFLPLTNTGSTVWTAIWDSSGTYVFASHDGVIYQTRFDASTDTISLLGTTTTTTGQLVSADQMSFLGGHLFAVNAQNLYVYNFGNGLLTPAPGSPVALGFPAGTVVTLQH